MVVSNACVVASKIRSIAMVIMAIVVALAASSLAVAQEPNRTEVKNAKLKDLLNERLATAKEFAKQVKMRFDNLQGTIDQLVEANRMLADAELDLCDSDKDKIAVLERFVATTKETEKRAAQLVRSGQALTSTELKARMERLQAEIALERAKATADAKKK